MTYFQVILLFLSIVSFLYQWFKVTAINAIVIATKRELNFTPSLYVGIFITVSIQTLFVLSLTGFSK